MSSALWPVGDDQRLLFAIHLYIQQILKQYGPKLLDEELIKLSKLKSAMASLLQTLNEIDFEVPSLSFTLPALYNAHSSPPAPLPQLHSFPMHPGHAVQDKFTAFEKFLNEFQTLENDAVTLCAANDSLLFLERARKQFNLEQNGKHYIQSLDDVPFLRSRLSSLRSQNASRHAYGQNKHQINSCDDMDILQSRRGGESSTMAANTKGHLRTVSLRDISSNVPPWPPRPNQYISPSLPAPTARPPHIKRDSNRLLLPATLNGNKNAYGQTREDTVKMADNGLMAELRQKLREKQNKKHIHTQRTQRESGPKTPALPAKSVKSVLQKVRRQHHRPLPQRPQ